MPKKKIGKIQVGPQKVDILEYFNATFLDEDVLKKFSEGLTLELQLETIARSNNSKTQAELYQQLLKIWDVEKLKSAKLSHSVQLKLLDFLLTQPLLMVDETTPKLIP